MGMRIRSWMCTTLIGGLVVLLLAFAALASEVDLQKAYAYVDENKEQILADWLELVRIPAPSKQEDLRAEWVRQKMLEVGLEDVYIDGLKNVVGTLKVSETAPTLVFAAHMDTVFPMDIVLDPVITDGILHVPGAGDNTPSVVALIHTVKALQAGNVTPKVNIVFVATSQEEIGLNGMKYFLETYDKPIDMVVAVDGGLGGVAYGALGIQWLKVTFNTPEGHSLSSRGKPSAARSLARAIDRLYNEIEIPAEPRSVMNVGMLGGGTVVNAIAAEAWFKVDMRSMDGDILTRIGEQVRQISEEVARETGATVSFEVETDIPGGQLPGAREHKLTQTAVAALESVGIQARLSDMGSCDSNAAIGKGIYSVAIGVTRAGGGHSVDEWAEIESIYPGIKQLIYIAANIH
ncbi:MAG: M20/M25/M40 family metallo-hydrolase [Firmicutes bacterium]|nr:M20/M25/M40 family metallo-hydrolase [Bacillota bacterium]